MKLSTRLFRAALVAGLVLVGIVSRAEAADSECLTAAKEAWEGTSTAALPNVCFKAKGAKPVRLDGSACQPSDSVYFEDKADVASQDVATLNKFKTPGCKQLFFVRAPDTVTNAPLLALDVARSKSNEALLNESDPVRILRLSAQPASVLGLTANAKSNAIGTGLPDVAAEAVQILGQIVVDRASQAAYQMLADKIKHGLKCQNDDGTTNQKTEFPATCEAIGSIRIQDLAMARDVLLRGLASDIVRAAFGALSVSVEARMNAAVDATLALHKLDPEKLNAVIVATRSQNIAAVRSALLAASVDAKTVQSIFAHASVNPAAEPVINLASNTLVSLLVGTLSDPTKKRAGVAAQAVVAELEAFARVQAFALLDATYDSAPERTLPLVFAGAALVVCETRVAQGQLPNLAACDISKEIDAFPVWSKDRRRTDRAKAVGRSVGRSLQTALTATSDNKPDADKRIIAAMNATFDATCFAVDPEKTLGCPAILDVPASDAGRAVLPLSLARGMLEAALERDTNRMVTTAVRGVETVVIPVLADADQTRARKRALRLLGGVVQYANTYYGQSAKDGEKTQSEQALHEQRTKILESLTEDMTDRVGREGDWIVSLGGSLALTAGVRFGDGKTVFNGPLSLSLGVGLQNVPSTCPVGLHLEVGVLDLGQYLSFQSKPQDASTESAREVVVRKPKVQDALSPSVKLGMQWGRDVPMYVAAAAGYAPFYEFIKSDGSETQKGAWTAGLAIGAYVPFVDFN